jgi:TPR repeat protein
MTKQFLALLVSSLFVTATFAGFTQGVQVNRSNSTQYTIKEFELLAESGDPKAQLSLGLMYAYGQGIPQDHAQAANWFLKAAEQGDARAQFNLGVMYALGQGVGKDYILAADWFRRAAEQGEPSAISNIGAMYAKGQGVNQDLGQAMTWTRKAADLGEPTAQYNLGLMYSIGQGVPQDFAQALQWFGRAAEQGDATAQYNLGLIFEQGRGVPRNLVIAYAFYNLSASIDFSEENLAKKNRDYLMSEMTSKQVNAGQQLTRGFSKKQVLLKTIFAYIKPRFRSVAQKPKRATDTYL